MNFIPRFHFKECFRDPTDNKSLIKVFEVKGHSGKCGNCNKKTNLIIRSTNERFPNYNYQDLPIFHWICNHQCMLTYIGYDIKKNMILHLHISERISPNKKFWSYMSIERYIELLRLSM